MQMNTVPKLVKDAERGCGGACKQVGAKLPLDLTQAAELGPGARWRLPAHLLDAVFYAEVGAPLIVGLLFEVYLPGSHVSKLFMRYMRLKCKQHGLVMTW